jgi:large subunit ribosomal protein L24
MKIKKRDNIIVISGRDKGKKGQILKVLPEQERVVVEAVRLVKKRIRPRKEGEKGQTVESPQPLHVSNVALICPQCGARTRVAYRGVGASEKKRICCKCQKIID